MHSNPAFRQQSTDYNLAFARQRGFGQLALNGDTGPLISHVPFILSDDGTALDLHLARPNPILRLLATPHPAVIAVSGPDGYVSPDWYGMDDQVPTWNYIAIHLRGILELAAPDSLATHLDQLSARFEGELAPKARWTSAKMSPGTMDRMMRAIVPCRMVVTGVQGTWKLGQNKAVAARLAAARHLAASPIGAGQQALAALMARDPD